MLKAHVIATSDQYCAVMNNEVDDTEKYLTKSSKKSKSNVKLNHQVVQSNVTNILVHNDRLENDLFNPPSVEDGIPGIAGDYGDQIVVTLLPSEESTSVQVDEDLNSSTSAGDIYLASSYASDDASHLSPSSSNDNMIYAELHITSDSNSPQNSYDVMDFDNLKLQPKRKEKSEAKKATNSKKVPLPATIELMEDPVRNLWVTSKSHKEQLKECGHSWTTGMWSKEETRILKENIDRYCMERSIKDPNDIIFRTSKEDRRDFYPTISNGLNRPLFAVYRRVKRMYDQRNHKGRYSREEVDKLKRLTKIHGRDWSTIARQLGRSSDSVKDRVRLLKDDPTFGKWTETEEQSLANAVYSVMRTKEGDSVTEGIPWTAVANRVGSRTEKQCRSKWLNYLNWKLFRGKEWTKEDDKLLVQKIAALNVANENEVNWNEISVGWSSVRSPTWLRKKWSDLKKILEDCGLGDISFTDTVKLLNKLFSEDIFKVWEKPRQLVKFLVGVQKAKNFSEASRKTINDLKEKPTNSGSLVPTNDVTHSRDSTPIFIQSGGADHLMTSELLTLSAEDSSCVSMTQQSLNSIVRPRTGSESTQSKHDFDLPTGSTELVCEATEDGAISLPQGTYHLTPTSSEGVFIIQTADQSSAENVTLPDNMGRVVNITVPPDVLKSMLVDQDSSGGLSFTDDTDHEYLSQTPSSSRDNPVLSSVARDVIVSSMESDDDVSIFVT